MQNDLDDREQLMRCFATKSLFFSILCQSCGGEVCATEIDEKYNNLLDVWLLGNRENN